LTRARTGGDHACVGGRAHGACTAVVAFALASACAKDPGGSTGLGSTTDAPTSIDGTADGSGESSASADSTGSTGASSESDGSGSTGAAETCGCAPGTDLVHVLSDDGELWSYDPASNAFALVGPVQCGGFAPFSMAVDREGMAWILLLDNVPMATVAKGMFKVPIADAVGCEAVVYEEGLFGVYGMSFVTNPPPDTCEKLYVQSYSGSGPFAEGPDLGHLGVLDPETNVLQSVGLVDYDGGELAGTGDGRLVSLTGVDPLKLVELDKASAEPLAVLELDGYEKTSASAMAFWGGDLWLFTESGNPACTPCLEAACTDELAACEAEAGCPAILECLVASGGEAPDCQGDLPGAAGPLRDCLWRACGGDCSADGVVSRVIHVDWDDSDGAGQAATTVEPFAPIRIVGAGSSTCAPVFVP
jgi:hypothetical protein